MYNIKTLVTAASMAVAMAAGVTGANAAPWDHRPILRHERQEVRHYRELVTRDRVLQTLRFHHYRGIAAPVFVHGHYVVRSHNRFGRVVFVEVNPYTGAFIGEMRI